MEDTEMRKASVKVTVGLVVLIGLSAVALAEPGENPVEGDGPRQGLRERRPGGGRGRKMLQRRMRAAHRLLNTEEGKALREEFRKTLEGIAAERKALLDAIRKDMEGGKNPREAFKERAAELKALMKKRMLAGLEFREKIIALARQNIDKAVDKIHEKLREHAKNRRQNPGEEGPGTDRLKARRRRFEELRLRRGGPRPGGHPEE